MSKASRKMNMRRKPRRLSKAWRRVVGALAVIVVFCTVYALVLPAITLSDDPICGQQAHEHTEACYRTEIRIPNCAAAAHVHNQDCDGPLGNPLCGFGERILHSHSDICYDQRGDLICELPERYEHLHSEACRKTNQTLICTLEEREAHVHTQECTAEAGLKCMLTETQGHTHGETCYKNEMILICEEKEQLPHTHGDDCYLESGALSCLQEETTGHTHLDSCYELTQQLICTEQEQMPHTHDDTCYTEAKTCSLEECEGHTHGQQCYEVHTQEACPEEQVADHRHTEDCFNHAGEKICDLISGVVHVHDETCFRVIRLDEPELICQLPEHVHVDACFLDPGDLPSVQKDFYCEMGVHEHTEECRDASGNLICTIPEHTHDVSCKVPDYDPNADVETAEDWEKTFKDLTLTGNWPQDLLNVAATQLDYRESKQNVIMLEDGSVKGYTRYGDWYGASHIDWSAAFVSFCVHYAKLDAMPQDASCESYRSKLEGADLFRDPLNYLPKPGDLVLLDTNVEDDEVLADRMGIVAELLRSDSGELTTLKVLVGDADGTVKYVTYDLLSSRIIGFGETPAGETRTLLCEKDHEHSNGCYGYKLYYTDDALHAQLLVQGIDDLPADVTLKIDRVTAANDPIGYSSMIAALNDRMEQSPYFMGDASFYQMTLLRDGQPYELPEGVATDVTVSFTKPVFTPEAMEGAAKVETFQLTLDETANTLSGTIFADMTQSNSGAGDTEQAGVASGMPVDLPLDIYQVEQVLEDTYENASGGLTGVGFESEMVTTFAVVLSNTTKTGQFWERVFSASEITAGGTYMIVSSEGNFALRGENNNNNTAVTIQAQKGEEWPDAPHNENPERNTRYYTITKTDGSAVDNYLYWTITPGNSTYTVRNQRTSNYLRLNGSLITNQSTSLTVTYKMPEQGWRFNNSSNYLRNKGTGSFEFDSGNDGRYGNTSNYYYYSRDMLVFKLSDVTSLKIPDDVIHVTANGTTQMEMVTDASTLQVGDRIIIAARNYNYALSTDQNSNDRGRASITKSGNICACGDDTQVITLVKGTATNTFGLDVGGQYLTAVSSRSNYLRSTTTLNANSSWSISINSSTGAATVKASGNYTRNLLRYNTSGIFTCYSSATNQEIVIYREVSLGPEKPDYGDFITVTDGLEDDTSLDKDGVSVKGRYFSDPSSSDIETQFRQDSYEASKIIDGKVVTDKSVIYGKDDYGAFDHYDPNTFSVALSALGQEYEIPYVHRVRTPVDVVFVLDVSGSMTSNSTSQGENPDRVVDLCEAVNASIAQIMDDHEANRVGISIYSSGAWELLPLDRYTANNDQYLVTQKKTFNHQPTNYGFTINYLLGSSSLRDSKGKSFANAGASAVQGIGTYTQAGIAMGNEIFEAIEDDTTYTTTVGEGDMERTYTVKRQPVIILVSDGEPTHSTSIYNDVLKGPHYGSGGPDPSTNGKGIHGYYTVLSANYYKRAVSIQYQKEAMFYSIGMGIHTSQDGPLVSTGKTGDNYKRAVLNPQMDTIGSLTSNKEKANTTDQLKNMLLSQYTGKTVQVSPDWPDNWYGVPHVYEPVLQPNPYEDDFEYADGAYFGDLPESELKKIFQDIYQSSMTYTTYGFVLYKNSSVDVFDHIGEGMEIKGTPVLRYAGVNHTDPEIIQDGNVTRYVYEGIYVDPYIPDREADLSHISVTVTTNADGTQTVEMYIMDQALPTYTPELIGREYYYEQLPVRLIYQVGLTEDAEKDILALNKTGGELVYYTNQWQDENGNEDPDRISTSILLPSTANPFYYHIDGTEPPYKRHHSLKEEDTTHTVDYHVDCDRKIEERDGETLIKVIHKQGNNGKLVFKADTISIPVKKQWGSGIQSNVMNPIQMNVYRVTETVDQSGHLIRNAELATTVTLSVENGWEGVAQGLAAPDGAWYYAIAETIPSGYTATYDRETLKITTDGETFFDAVKFEGGDTAVIVRNDLAVQLPATGGGGAQWYTLGGLLLMSAAVILWYSFYLKRRREARYTF